jgi:polar amino acid transport system permease protein
VGGLTGGPPDLGLTTGLGQGGPPRAKSRRRVSWRSIAVATISTIVFFSLLGWIVVNSPGWDAVKESFLNAEIFWAALPDVIEAFWVNVRLFLIAEILILVFGLVLAVLRSLSGPVFFPIRMLSTFYVDLFRALPGILVIFMLGFGIPALGIAGVPVDPFFWGVVTLTLLYSAYVSEVYRAGINSVHPSQEAAARSLGLSRLAALRYVVVPQAIRRVIPPLLNDFIGLQKDTALVGLLGLVEAFRRADMEAAPAFNFTPYVVTAILFLALTIPLSRFVDWLVARDQRRQMAGAR